MTIKKEKNKGDKVINELYSISDYKEVNDLQNEDDELILFEYIKKVSKVFNKDIVYSICNIDSSIEQSDLEAELYIQGLKHIRKYGILDYTSYTLRDDLLNILSKFNAKKRKRFTATLNEDYHEDENLSVSYDFDSPIIMNNLLNTVNKDDKDLLLKYYIEGYTYEELKELANSKTRDGVKKKITKILGKINNNI